MRKARIDAAGAALLIAFSALLGLNQVMIKLVNDGIEPVFQAALRSLAALPLVLAWALWRGRRLSVSDGSLWPGIFSGLLFGSEFVALFLALDLTTVARTSVFFYTMPVWVTLGAHLLIPGEGLTGRKLAGLGLAVAGVAWAVSDRSDGQGALIGDLLALSGALGWAGIALLARTTKLSKSSPEMQLIYQLAVSPLILVPAAIVAGKFLREPQAVHWALFAVQVVVVASAGFLTWFWVLSIYPAAQMAAFSFLAPVFGVAFGWLILGEPVTVAVLGALVLVSLGIVLINTTGKAKKG